MIDLKNLDKLSPEQRNQFNALLEQFPHLDSKMQTSRELNTPSKSEVDGDEIDYSNFTLPSSDVKTSGSTNNRDLLPKLKVNPEESLFTSSLSSEDDDEDIVAPHSKEAAERKKEQERARRVQVAVKAGQPYEVASFNPEGKAHPVLQKLRATVGLRSVQKPVVCNVGGCNYSMRPLDRANIANATVLALTTTTNQLLYESNLESAIIAYSVVAIDDVPLMDIFSIPKSDIFAGDQTPTELTTLQREEKAANAFYMELLRSPNELVEALGVYYQQEFPPLTLLSNGKSKFLCPEANCLQARIADYDAVCYCPAHGVQMAREDLLPNPS
jgi:hypothetical protein